MKHAAIKTKSSSKSALPKTNVSSKTANKKIIKMDSKQVPRLKVSSSKLKTESSKKANGRSVEDKTARISTGKKTVTKDKSGKRAVSQNSSKKAVSSKKTKPRAKSKTLRTKRAGKPEISKKIRAAKPENRKAISLEIFTKQKAVSDVKLKVRESKKANQKDSAKKSASGKIEDSKKQVSTVKKTTKPVRKKAERIKAVDKKLKTKLQISVKARSPKTENLAKSGKAPQPVSQKAKRDSKPVKSENKKAAIKKVLQKAEPKVKSRFVSTAKKTQAKIQAGKKSSPVRKVKNKTVKTAEKVLVTKNKQIKNGKAFKPLTVKNLISKNKFAGRVSAKKAVKKKNLTKPIPIEVQKPKKKAVRPISSAVFRGKKSQYDFKVFSIDEKFEPLQAVYIISRRFTDKRKRGHHKLICIGQTDSLTEGIKMHKQGKCIRQNEANVICLLKEEDENNRLRIEADLREAHSINCNRQ